MDAEEKEVSVALRLATEDVAILGKRRFRQQTTSAGLGKKVANAWRHDVFPRRGVQTMEPAARVISKAPDIIRAFDEGQTIRSKDRAGWLAIPTDYAPSSRRRGSRGRKMSADEFIETFGNDSLEVFSKSGASWNGRENLYLFAPDGFRKSRGKRKGSRRVKEKGRIKSEKVLMYVLVKQVRLSKRLNVSSIERTLRRLYPNLITRRLHERLGK
ncbi:MAG: DUF6441 family protein [Roseibium sp.]|uniref:DUF6441 family protein n=1 Tax=Roseibium sp. TaxID=1936156 RepID=UPI00261E44FE|nr:DUF6441 family protein [Roseibium sp.]MCV0429227.1 DUF6441 family protein [Roseibium sp.]